MLLKGAVTQISFLKPKLSLKPVQPVIEISRGLILRFTIKTTDHKCHGIAPSERVECGFYGITRETCESTRGCCYDSSVSGVPHCFHGKSKPGKFPLVRQSLIRNKNKLNVNICQLSVLKKAV